MAKELNCRVYDRQIICLLAEKLGLNDVKLEDVSKYLDSYNEKETITFSPYTYPAAGVAGDMTDAGRDDPGHYDMIVNVGKTGVNGAVRMILDYIMEKETEN